ncbi:MAG: WbqC family protein, partial [Nitrososphaerota archaeon]|nr:WbqC family protein [Nitrososphaerota archaeon]
MNRVILKKADLSSLNDTQSGTSPYRSDVLALDGALILSGHQPTFLPYPGFFYRMFHSDVMDICP